MTKKDLLYGNVDLVRSAVKLLNKKPIYSLSLEPLLRKTSRGVRVTCTSKLPKGKQKVPTANTEQNIAYVNIDVDGRWYKTINAKKGSINREPIILKGRRRKKLLVQAFDEQNNLVAACRQTV